MSKKKRNIKGKVKFILLVIVTIVVTIMFAKYVSELLFEGKNSLQVYNVLKEQKNQLQNNIKSLQFDNARLQKEYFELKNLEPEE